MRSQKPFQIASTGIPFEAIRLMNPIMAGAAALSLGWPIRALRMAAFITAAVVIQARREDAIVKTARQSDSGPRLRLSLGVTS